MEAILVKRFIRQVFNFGYTSVDIYIYSCTNTYIDLHECNCSQKASDGSLGVGAVGSCESFSESARNTIWVFCKSCM